MKWMLIDLEELAGNIASKVNGARLTPVIEKEIVHYEIIRSLGRNDLLRDITFQGGTSLRLCYGSLRYSEDLDFVAGDKFDSLPLDDFSKTLRSDLLKSYDTEVSVREPKVVNDFDGVGCGDGRCPLIPTSRARFAETADQAGSRPFRRIRPRFAGSRSTIPNLMECMTTRSGARRSRRFWPTS
ncbi:MAG: nucleotidyl transferase AbiEii/AbiGii toxin family protein [Eggerthellaceae bacterium]